MDLIDRQAAIDVVNKNTFRLTFAEEQNCEGHVAWSANAVYSDVMEGALLELPSVQPQQKGEPMSGGVKWLKVDECGTWRKHLINLDNILFIRQPELTDRNDIIEIAIKDFGTLKAYGQIEEVEEELK